MEHVEITDSLNTITIFIIDTKNIISHNLSKQKHLICSTQVGRFREVPHSSNFVDKVEKHSAFLIIDG